MSASDFACVAWRKSSWGGEGQNCVEVACSTGGVRAVRDGKRPDGAVLVLDTDVWRAFVGGLKEGPLV
ncbi:DUF397 domain-containing protein [Sphaerisporangium siamense]|uniref:DUF397 domain-containing protein n=1 Tax=Sphaerisporangium siamense TaxID=795645 RepID=UPI00161A628C|nr:DUF397 domain-containing protein [Sphaerisporangium siamense]